MVKMNSTWPSYRTLKYRSWVKFKWERTERHVPTTFPAFSCQHVIQVYVKEMAFASHNSWPHRISTALFFVTFLAFIVNCCLYVDYSVVDIPKQVRYFLLFLKGKIKSKMICWYYRLKIHRAFLVMATSRI